LNLPEVIFFFRITGAIVQEFAFSQAEISSRFVHLGCKAAHLVLFFSGEELVTGVLVMTKSFSIFGSSPTTQLGPFEQQVLQKLWSHGSATVRELLADGTIRQAYTTVMTTADRLYKKGLLDRVAEGRAFRYTPRHTPQELQRVAALEGITQLLGSGDASSLPLSYLVEALSSHDEQLLDELQLLVERKRRELQSREKDRENEAGGQG
jgi:predicted transcriptional regulator